MTTTSTADSNLTTGDQRAEVAANPCYIERIGWMKGGNEGESEEEKFRAIVVWQNGPPTGLTCGDVWDRRPLALVRMLLPAALGSPVETETRNEAAVVQNSPIPKATGEMSEDTGTRWRFCEMRREPSFWCRKPEPGEIDGLDPLSGFIIAHSEEEMRRLDAKAKVQP